jgi:choline dehydrogenase
MKYDYIIIGGGSAGCVTANKLVNNKANVLLIEEGGDYKNPFLKMPAGFIPMLDGSPYHRFHKTINQKQLNGRQHDIAQGKILGGGSSINGMVYMRGRPSDYEIWEKEVDDKFWSWEHLLNSYVTLEGNQRLNNKYHGINGPLKVSDPKYVVKGTDLYIKTMQGLGLPFNSDFNDGNQYGVGLMQLTTNYGKRCSAVDAFIDPIRDNNKLNIKLKNIVTKIIIEKNKAIGVEVFEKGKINKYFANNEVIITAGTYISPKILMHSGIGDEEELKSHNIKTIVNLKGVGKNLQDHHEVPYVVSTKKGYGYFKQDKGLRKIINGLQYILFNSGPVTSNAAETCAFLNPTDLKDNIDPPIKLYCVQIMYTDRDTKDIKPNHGLTLTSCIMNPKARGDVKLRSSNPLDLPLINPNFFSNQDDLKLMIDSVKFARSVVKSKPLSDIVIDETLPGKNIKTNEDLINYCKRTVKTNWHPVGTCKMGKEDDPYAVLNNKLQVYGIENLRVFDVSMMPKLVSGNTNAPAMAIANNAVNIMLDE